MSRHAESLIVDTKARNNDWEEFRSSEFIAFQADKEKPALKNDYPGRRPEGDMLISVESPEFNIRSRGREPQMLSLMFRTVLCDAFTVFQLYLDESRSSAAPKQNFEYLCEARSCEECFSVEGDIQENPINRLRSLWDILGLRIYLAALKYAQDLIACAL
ncbi:unnamed protein product [Danaus chrysippus]|uniref:(African queen) hypothetical protein n=1 Tax=Danaus chrysippus TaxID=151541 RepID=A0A8J2QJP4_9NEOP|nr:unnamed protein product [Danaus chrysippus]